MPLSLFTYELKFQDYSEEVSFHDESDAAIVHMVFLLSRYLWRNDAFKHVVHMPYDEPFFYVVAHLWNGPDHVLSVKFPFLKYLPDMRVYSTFSENMIRPPFNASLCAGLIENYDKKCLDNVEKAICDYERNGEFMGIFPLAFKWEGSPIATKMPDGMTDIPFISRMHGYGVDTMPIENQYHANKAAMSENQNKIAEIYGNQL